MPGLTYMPDNRATARTLGLRFYMATECPLHPASPRYTANALCVECCKVRRRAAAPAMRERDATRKRVARAAAAKAKPAPSPAVASASAFDDLLG